MLSMLTTNWSSGQVSEVNDLSGLTAEPEPLNWLMTETRTSTLQLRHFIQPFPETINKNIRFEFYSTNGQHQIKENRLQNWILIWNVKYSSRARIQSWMLNRVTRMLLIVQDDEMMMIWSEDVQIPRIQWSSLAWLWPLQHQVCRSAAGRWCVLH